MGTVTKTRAKIGTAWIGRELSWLEVLMLESFVATGHEVTLFSDQPEAMPKLDGVTVTHMREVFDYSENERKHMPPAAFVDLFRLNMIARTALTWVDTDVVSTKPLELWNGYLMVRDGGIDYDHITNAFLCLPKTSPALIQMVDEVAKKDLDYSWMRHRMRKQILELPQKDRFIGASKISRQVYGPSYVTSRLVATDEFAMARPKETLDAVPWDLTDLFFDPKGGCYNWFTDDTVGAHIALSQLRKRHINKGPQPGSFLHSIQEKVQAFRKAQAKA